MITRRDFISSAAAASLLPSFGKSTAPYDYEVEYLESTGTQYIDTNVAPTANIGFTVVFSVDTVYSSWTKKICGAANVQGGAPHFDVCINSSKVTAWVGGGFCAGPTVVVGEKYEASILKISGSWKFLVNDYTTSITTGQRDLGYSGNTFILFGSHSQDNNLNLTSSKIYGFKMYDYQSGEKPLVYDMIPVVKSGKGMMYDKVSGILFENRGAGEFITGPRKGVEMSPVAMGEAKFSARSYVQDGLIVMLDAKSGVGLKDFVSGRDLNVVGSVELEEDCYYFSNPQSYAFFNMTDEDVALFSSASTIEVCYTPIEYGGASFNGISGIGDLEILTQSSGNIYLSKYFFGTSRVGYGSAICATITADSSEARIFKDGIFMTGKSGQYPVINKATGFKFNRRENYTIYGLNGLKIHSCRFYNRPLSASEIASNYAIDKARFNLQ